MKIGAKHKIIIFQKQLQTSFEIPSWKLKNVTFWKYKMKTCTKQALIVYAAGQVFITIIIKYYGRMFYLKWSDNVKP